MQFFSSFIIPFIITFVIIYGLFKGINVFDIFLVGAKQGLIISIKILPALIALMVSIGMLISSGAIDIITNALSGIFSFFGLPSEVIPLALLRPISGSGALTIFQSILNQYGPDSEIGRIASVMLGSTETTFYTIAIYYSAAKVIKTRFTLIPALTADIIGFIMSAITVSWIF